MVNMAVNGVGSAVMQPRIAGEPTVTITKIGADEERYEEKLSSIANRLETLAQEQVTAKGPIEQRWLDAIRAYHGKYDEKFLASLKAAKQSVAYIKAARAKTVALEARLFDLIFPTDDRNWGINPTPVPKLADEQKEAELRATNAAQQANEAGAAGDADTEAQIVAAGNDQAERAKVAEAEIIKITRACKLMQEEMDDQLVESQYPQHSRRSIHNFCQLGTAVLKGPVVNEERRGKWVPDAEAQDPAAYKLHIGDDPRPKFRYTDPWSFFPDMSAGRISEAEFTFERYLWTASDLRKQVKTMGFNPDAVRELLRDNRANRANSSPGLANLVLLRSLTDDNSSGSIKGRYVGWEYHGPLECDEVVTILNAMGRAEEAAQYAQRDDPLEEHRVVIFFCEGTILKIAPEYPLDSGETLYSLANLEDAEGSMFGYGIPSIMMDSGDALNSAWRAALDNGAMSVGPQMVLDKTTIEPADGDWAFAPKKIWLRVKAALQGEAKPVEFFNVPNNQGELSNIAKMAFEFIDMETGMPQPQQGEQGSHTTQTVGGMAILQNAANIIFRRIVKNWDDGIITPSMRRLYDWNMQFSKREEIKGDMQVDARGTSVLLVKEVQAQNLMVTISQLAANPEIRPLLKLFPLIEKLFQAMMLKPSEVMLTEDEYEAFLKQQQEAPPPPSPAEISAQARIESAKIMAEVRANSDQVSLQLAEIKRQVEVLNLAQQGELTVKQIEGMLRGKEMELQSKERSMVTEAAIEEKLAEKARERGEDPAGSGGNFSAGEEGKTP